MQKCVLECAEVGEESCLAVHSDICRVVAFSESFRNFTLVIMETHFL